MHCVHRCENSLISPEAIARLPLRAAGWWRGRLYLRTAMRYAIDLHWFLSTFSVSYSFAVWRKFSPLSVLVNISLRFNASHLCLVKCQISRRQRFLPIEKNEQLKWKWEEHTDCIAYMLTGKYWQEGCTCKGCRRHCRWPWSCSISFEIVKESSAEPYFRCRACMRHTHIVWCAAATFRILLKQDTRVNVSWIAEDVIRSIHAVAASEQRSRRTFRRNAIFSTKRNFSAFTCAQTVPITSWH